MIVSIIAAIAENWGIGKDNDIPWRLKDDLKRFKELTMGHHLILGRRTYESIGKVLPGRDIIVVSRNPNYQADGCRVALSLTDALGIARARGEDEVFIGGGEEVYRQALGLADRMYITWVHSEVDADVYFPEFDEECWEITRHINHDANAHNQFAFSFIEYKRLKSSNNF